MYWVLYYMRHYSITAQKHNIGKLIGTMVIFGALCVENINHSQCWRISGDCYIRESFVSLCPNLGASWSIRESWQLWFCIYFIYFMRNHNKRWS